MTITFSIFKYRPHFSGNRKFLRIDHTPDHISEHLTPLTKYRRKSTPRKLSETAEFSDPNCYDPKIMNVEITITISFQSNSRPTSEVAQKHM